VIRAVVDTSVLVSAFIGSPQAGPGKLVDAWRDGRFIMVVSPLLIAELTEVLARPKFARWSSGQRHVRYVAAFAARSEQHPDPVVPAAGVRDPADEYLVALARATGAEILVSLDGDLLEAGLSNLVVVDPMVFLAQLQSE
jgi:uncharacterized protein